MSGKPKPKDPLQDVDETVPGFLPDPSTYVEPTPGGKRRARTFSQAIADATRGADAGMNRFTPQKPDLNSSAYKPDWRGHYKKPSNTPAPRAALQLETMPSDQIHPLTLAERMRMGKYSPDQARDKDGKWTSGSDGMSEDLRATLVERAINPKNDPSQARDESGKWTGEGFHGTGRGNLKSILEHGIDRRDQGWGIGKHVYIARDPSAAAHFGSLRGDSGSVVFKIEVPEKYRGKFHSYVSESAMANSALRGDVKVRPEWIKAWATVKPGSSDLGAWRVVRKADEDGVFYIAVSLPDLEKYDPSEPRDDQGQWTDGASGAAAAAGEVTASATPENHNLDHRVVGVGGDEWNKKTAVRLETEYQAAKPKIESLIERGIADDESISGKFKAGTIQTWDDLNETQQGHAETEYVSQTQNSEQEALANDWYDNEMEGHIRAGMASGDDEDTAWKDDAVKDYFKAREEDGEPELPFKQSAISDAIKVSAGGEITIDNEALGNPKGWDDRQMTFPGIEPAKPWDALSADARKDILREMQDAYETEYDHRKDNIEPPNFWDTAINNAHESWDEMDDEDKFSWVKHNTDVLDDAHAAEDDDEERQLKLPHVFAPITTATASGATAEDYADTGALARWASLNRTAEILKERGLPVDAGSIEQADKSAWKAWVDSSSSRRAKELQVAASEELGGRVRMAEGDIADVKRWADEDFQNIGGYAGLKAYSRAKWETTQYILDKAGLPSLQLYRGLKLDQETVDPLPVEEVHVDMEGFKPNSGYTDTFKRLPTISIVRNGLSSTTADEDVANNWGGIGVETDHPVHVTLRAEVPRTAVLSVPAYGNNIAKEKEVVVMGTAWNKWDAWMGRAPKLERVAIAKGSKKIPGITQRGRELEIDIAAYEEGGNMPNWLSPKGRGTVKKDYDPSEPRDNAGRWTDGGGGVAGDASGAAELGQSVEDDAAFEEGYSPWPRHHEPRLSEEDTGTLHGAQFASPSITDKDFNQASEAIHGERQQAFGRASQEIDKELGMEGVRNTDVIGAWADGAENSTMAEIRRPGSLEALRVSAAMKGALANQKAVLIFQTDPRGPDSLYQLALKGEPAEVHDQLLKAGIPFHTLNKLPGYSGETGVTVVDQGGELHQKIGQFADAHKTLALEFNGHAEFLGDAQGTGSDAEQRSRAQDAYAKIIEGATSSYQGRTAGAVWQGVRDRWAKQIEVLKRGYRSFTERLLERREL